MRRSAWWSRGLVGGLAALTLAGLLVANTFTRPQVPDFAAVKQAHAVSETVLLDRNGDPLHVMRADYESRALTWVPLTDISPALIRAVIAAEDSRFDSHGGIDWLALGAAAKSYLFGNARRGGASTIAMQVARLDIAGLEMPRRERTISYQLHKMQAGRALVRAWGRDQVLEAYLNMISFRGELQGISAAAQGLFGKHPQGLNGNEAAILAALIRGPNAAAKTVARRACGLVDAARCPTVTSLAKTVLSRPYRIRPPVSLAPHVAARLSNRMAAGGRLQTTLDADLQRYVEESIANHVQGLIPKNLRDAAVLVVDIETGAVRAYVGGSGSFSSASYVDGVQARRQAGSTLKPFIYGLGIEKRLLTAATLLEDSPLEISVAAGGVYRPRNYDNLFHGPVTVREALASSLNTPAVRAVLSVGPGEAVKRLQDLGFQELMDPEFYGASLALGSADITLWDLVNGYRTLANGGRWSPLHLMGEGDIATRQVVEPGTAYIIGDILADRGARSLGFGLASPLATAYFAAVKTGTSKDMRDNWCVGFSDRYVVGVWAGNFSGEPMWNVSGISGAAPIWRDVMDYLHQHDPAAVPAAPAGLVRREITIETTGETRPEWFLPGTAPEDARISVAEKHVAPRILYPTDGALLARDPDIPDDLQALVPHASGGRGLSWVLNG
ncbi:MAG: penicillin-binding protein 1C, partial [Magnetospiraceae bacterium]